MVVMGRVTAPWGVKGAVKVEPWSAERESLCRFPAWWVGKPGELRETAVAECREHGTQLVARFEGCTGREQAEAYRGCDVAISRAALPRLAKHEFYQADVIGFEVVNEAGERLGRVAGFLDNGAHGIMRVGHEGGERLLPLAAGVVRRVDTDARRIEVEWGADW
jgi:16S rRNA processing protein RimM